MQTKAVRLHGTGDLRLDAFELPDIGAGDILATVVSDSVCMSTYKAASLGTAHKRVPADVAGHPVIIGHEFCGEIIAVGARWQDQFKPGDRFAIQPALNDPAHPYAAPGYSFTTIGGSATHIVIPPIVMERGCLLPFTGEAFFHGSLAEPVSCIVGAFHVNYHTDPGSHEHRMGIVAGGSMALLAGAGPMGLGAIDYAIHNDRRPSLLVVTDIDAARLERAGRTFTVEEAARQGVTLRYVDTSGAADVPALLRGFTEGHRGFDDVFVFAPVPAVIEQADRILGFDGCLNFFAGPSNPDMTARFNVYNVHYHGTHVAGNSGGNTDDIIESLDLMARGRINPAAMVTHIGGLNSVIETTLGLPDIPGGKKLIYTQIDLPLTALADLRARSGDIPLFGPLADRVDANGGLWSAAAERFLLANAKPI